MIFYWFQWFFIKYENQAIQGSIEPEAEKTQSFIYEFLSYITLIEEFRTQSNIQDGTFVKIFNGVVVLSL